MAALSQPSSDLATRLVSPRPPEQTLLGYVMNQMSGNVPHRLATLEEAVHFLHAPPAERLLQVGGKPSLSYVDPGVLARWLEEALGDRELALEVRHAFDSSPDYLAGVNAAKVVMQQRLEQCRAVRVTAEPAVR